MSERTALFPYREGVLFNGVKVVPLTEGEYFRMQEVHEELLEALKMTAVRWTPALDGYCWCSRNSEPSKHETFCLIAKDAIASAEPRS